VPSATILIVDDEALVRWSLKERLTAAGYDILEAGLASEALERLAVTAVDLILLDSNLPDGDGLRVLKRVHETAGDTQVIVMTAPSTTASGVEAMKLGACHYINKPVNPEEAVLLVEKALETSRLRRDVRALRKSQACEFDAIIGASPAIQTLRALLAEAANSPAATVLLTGEAGTGKDLAARTIHYNSDRAGRPFVKASMSVLPEQLVDTTLSGQERGAFTDARQPGRGLFDEADGGTLFLDDIGEMTAGPQAKLLRLLEQKAFKRVGGLSDIRVDVRVVAATTRNLEHEVSNGTFREDLFQRLQGMRIAFPPLRERHGDIPILTSHYIDLFNRDCNRRVRGVSPETMAMLERYQWPGNVRELRNAIERAMMFVEHEWLQPADFATLRRIVKKLGLMAKR
jgi:two-component system response regulator AtoC